MAKWLSPLGGSIGMGSLLFETGSVTVSVDPTTLAPRKLDEIKDAYQKALRAWHVAWMARVDRHVEHFYPLAEREQSLVYEAVIEERRALKDAESRAYDRFLQARDVLSEALRTHGGD